MAEDTNAPTEAPAITPLSIPEIQEVCSAYRCRLLSVDHEPTTVDPRIPPVHRERTFTVTTPRGKDLDFSFATTTRAALAEKLKKA